MEYPRSYKQVKTHSGESFWTNITQKKIGFCYDFLPNIMSLNTYSSFTIFAYTFCNRDVGKTIYDGFIVVLTHIPHFRHVVQKDTWIIITILSQQIK